MSAVPLDPHPGPWTEEEFLALPEDRHIELLDGGLLVTPAASGKHQRVAFLLALQLYAAVPDEYEVLESVNVRLAPSRILIPDVVVTSCLDGVAVYEAADMILVAEVVSPSHQAIDRLIKPQFYAAASIGWYLRVELGAAESPEVIAYRLSDGVYAEHGRAQPGE